MKRCTLSTIGLGAAIAALSCNGILGLDPPERFPTPTNTSASGGGGTAGAAAFGGAGGLGGVGGLGGLGGLAGAGGLGGVGGTGAAGAAGAGGLGGLGGAAGAGGVGILGQNLWSERFGNAAYDGAMAVVTDSTNRILITGGFKGDINFGGGNLNASGFSKDIFVARLDSNGNHSWSQAFGTGMMHCEGHDIAADSTGGFTATGFFRGTKFSFDGGSTEFDACNGDAFVVKFNADGSVHWSAAMAVPYNSTGYAIAFDSADGVVVTGGFKGAGTGFDGQTPIDSTDPAIFSSEVECRRLVAMGRSVHGFGQCYGRGRCHRQYGWLHHYGGFSRQRFGLWWGVSAVS